MDNKSADTSDVRLKSRKLIGKLFAEGQTAKAYPIRIQYILHDIDHHPPLLIGVSVSKRHFKRAVDRNKIKRQLREAYREHQHQIDKLASTSDEKVAMMIIYGAPERWEYHRLSSKLKNCLKKIEL